MSRLSAPAKRLVKLLVFALVVHLFVIPQIGGARKALFVLGAVNPWLLAGALGLEVLSFLAYARLTQLLIPRKHRPSVGVSFGAVTASTGVNHLVPGGAATTVAMNYRILGRSGVPTDELGFALGTEAIGSAVVLNVILWLALVASIPATGFQPIYATAAAVGAVLIAVIAVAVVLLLRGRTAVANRVARLAGHLPKVESGAVRKVMLGLAEQLDALVSDRRRLTLILGFAALNWLLDAAALWLAMTAFGPRPAVVGLLVAYGLANVMAVVPVSPGGLGVIEAILIPTLVGFGSPRSQAAIGVVVYRLVNFWMPIPVGAVAYLVVNRFSHHHPEGFVDEVKRRAA